MTKARPWAINILAAALLALPGVASPANLTITPVSQAPFQAYGSSDSGPFQLPRSGRLAVHLMIYSGSCQWQTSNDQDSKVYAGTAGYTPSPNGTINADSTGPSEEVIYTPTKYVQSVGNCAWGIYVREN